MTFKIIKTSCATEQDLQQLAGKLAQVVQPGAVIFLHGPLGAGKTTFSRGFLAALGHRGKVKSPTYTLVEQYHLGAVTINHFDLYRLDDEVELEQIGVRDYFQPSTICLIEWPEKGAGLLPQPDIQCEIDFASDGRTITLAACNERANAMLSSFDL